MIHIVIDQKISLDISDDQEINIVFENPFFLNGEIPAPYSLDVELPNTFHNSQSLEKTNKDNIIEIYYDNYLLFKGSITSRSETNSNITLNLLGANLPKSLSEDLRKFDLGSDIVNVDASVENARRKELISSKADIIYIPHYKKGGDDLVQDMTDLSWVYSKYMNWYDVAKKSSFTPSPSSGFNQALTSPTIKLSYLLKRILPNASGFFDDTDLYVATHLGDKISFMASSSETETIRLDKFFEQLKAEEFVSSAMNLFCCVCYASGTDFVFKSRTETINGVPLCDWSTKIDTEYSISFEEGQTYSPYFSNGYFNSPLNIGMVVCDTLDGVIRIGVLPPDSFVDCSYYMVGNDVYMWDKEQLSYVGIRNIAKGDDSTDVSLAIELAPASVYVGLNAAYVRNPALNQWDGWKILSYCSSYIDDVPIIGYLSTGYDYWGNEKGTYSYLTTYNKDMEGNVIAEDEITLEKDTPFYNKWHKPYELALGAKQATLSRRIDLSAKELSELDLSKKVLVHNSEYLIKSLDVTIYPNCIGYANVELFKML